MQGESCVMTIEHSVSVIEDTAHLNLENSQMYVLELEMGIISNIRIFELGSVNTRIFENKIMIFNK